MSKNNLCIEKCLKLLLFIIILFLPNILKVAHTNYISPILEPVIMRTGMYINIFVQYKFSFLIISTFLLLLLFMIYIYKKNISLSLYDYFIGLFIFFTLVSTYLSDYTYISLWGKYNRTDGAVFFISLVILLFVASKINFTDKDIDIFSYAFFPFLLINTALAYMFQNKINILERKWFKNIVLSGGEYNVGNGGYILSTLENPNYLSGIAGFLTIYFITRFVFLKKINVIEAVASLLSVFLLMSSFSSSGIVAVILTVLPLVVFLNKTDIYSKLKLLIFIPVIYFFINFFIKKDASISREVATLNKIIDHNIVLVILGLLFFLLIIYFIKNYAKYEKYKYILTGGIAFIILVGVFVFPYSPYYQQTYPYKIYEQTEIFEIIENKEIEKDFLSNRVGTWRNTIDLIKVRPFTGYGFGTLVFELNQNNIFDSNSKWPSGVLFDKPHNTYLEVSYGGGILAVISFLLIFVNLFFESFEKLREKFDARNLSIFLGMIAFLIQGIVNDSNVGSYPVMFIFFGILISRLNNNDEIMEVEKIGKETTKHKRNKRNYSS